MGKTALANCYFVTFDFVTLRRFDMSAIENIRSIYKYMYIIIYILIIYIIIILYNFNIEL